ncbi:hypothetical protein [Cupriavidus basilensis]|uniref:hypothetical protein n=1 Tax=Cupriavidus basilensis TaxID=68895 RepID=UPI00157AD39B|nr:hypothetical protein [Cupriavidus basilensis]NUA30627.1 hypothetical protein [Cupriavidus basilensis]
MKVRAPSNATDDDLYNAYLALFETPFRTQFKRRALEELALEVKQWHVTHISLEAVKSIRATGDAKGVRRGHHKMERKERGVALFESETPLTRQEFVGFFFDNDHVTLVVPSENGKNGTDHWSHRFPVPEGYFIQTGSFRVSAKKRDIDWATNVLDTTRHG